MKKIEELKELNENLAYENKKNGRLFRVDWFNS